MANLPTLPRRTLIEKISITLASALIAIGIVTWAGWALQINSLLQPIGNLPPAKANEAICWLLLGAALLVSEYGFVRYSWIAGLGALIGALSLGEYVLGTDLRIDELLAKDYLLIETAFAGRMASMTAGCILLGGLNLAWRAIPVGKKTRLFSEAVCGSIISSVGFSTLLGYAVSLRAVYSWGSNTAVGMASGLGLLLLGTALLINSWRVSYKEEGGPPIWSPMPVVIGCFTMTVILWIGMREREMMFLSNNTQSSLNQLASLTDIELKQITNEVEDHLSAAWSRTPTDMANSWTADATSFYELRKEYGCVSVGWVDLSWHTRWIFPRDGNEGALSFDHMSDETRSNAMRAASEKRRAIISQSVTIPQNQSQGFIIYAPVVRDGQLAGYAFTEFNYKEFFTQLDSKLKLSTNYEYLVVVNGTSVSGNLLPEDLAKNPYALEFWVSLHDRRIRFSLAPNESNLQRNRRYLPELTLLSGLGITLLLGLSVHLARTARSGMLAAEQSNRRLLGENDERRRVEDRLKISDERLRLALDSTGIGIFEWNVVSGYVYYSTGLWSMLGYEPNRMAATAESFQALIHPEDLPHFRRRIDAQLSGATPYIDPEFRVRARSGDWRWVYWRARSVATSATDIPTRILGTMQDVTSRREAEEALRASQAATRKLSLVASRTDNLVIIFAPDGRVEWVNEAFSRTMEYSLTEIAGKRLAEFLAGSDTDPRSIGRVRTALSHGQPISTDIVQYSKSGRKFHLSYDIQPVRNKAAEIENFIAVASDITARVETEQALRRAKSEADAASRAKSEFLASMSHEIRTPMNGVIGMTSLLLETAMSQEQREYVNTIRSSGESLLTIINDILDFSKIESGKMELERLPFDIGSCVEEALELFSVQAAAKRLELVYHIDQKVPSTVLGDVTRLRQVLVNLVNNAVKFTPSGSIAVEVHLAPGDPLELGVPPGRMLLEFSVKDTGIGIPPDRLDRLFKIFSQVDSSTTRKYGGTGLGLAICERLCTLMGGEIRVESTESKGSKFIFTMQTEAATSQRDDALPVLPAVLQKGTILVSEDNPVGQQRLQSLFSAWGAKVVMVANPTEARQAVENTPDKPVLLVFDFDPQQTETALISFSTIKCPRLVMLPFGYAPPDAPADGNSYAYIGKPIRAGGLYQTIHNIFATTPNIGISESAPAREPALGEKIPLDVLLVEDNPVNQKVALRFLDRLGYKADAANNGLEALNALEGRHYHLVLMDLQMPEMDGLEASKQIRMRLTQERQPKIIALTANALRGDRELCMQAGMDDYITKPVKMQEIADAIKRQFAPTPVPVVPPPEGLL